MVKAERMKTFLFGLVFLAAFAGFACKDAGKELKEGKWRGTLKTVSGVEIPFNFDVVKNQGKTTINLLNGAEKLPADEVIETKDSLTIKLPFDSEIKASKTGSLAGKWIKHLDNRDVEMSFSAEPDEHRFFNTNSNSKFNLSGRWSTIFSTSEKTTLAIGEFRQKGVQLTGTFLTQSGDYLFLEGTVSGNKLYLSTFDGSNAYLFTAKIGDNNSITDGKFYSGLKSVKDWSATRDEKAMLPDAYSLIGLKSPNDKIDFTFRDLSGRNVSLSDAQFKNKVVLVQLLGSWCPNCMDETRYLIPVYNRLKNKGFEIVGLGYEVSKDYERQRKTLQKLKDRLNIPYTVLATGYTTTKEEVLKSLPMLDGFKGFPTSILIDQKGQVRKIHTGFAGPGTGKHFEEFKKEFEQNLNLLLAEPAND